MPISSSLTCTQVIKVLATRLMEFLDLLLKRVLLIEKRTTFGLSLKMASSRSQLFLLAWQVVIKMKSHMPYLVDITHLKLLMVRLVLNLSRLIQETISQQSDHGHLTIRTLCTMDSP